MPADAGDHTGFGQFVETAHLVMRGVGIGEDGALFAAEPHTPAETISIH